MDWETPNLSEAWDKFQKHVDLMFAGPYKAKTEAEKTVYLLIWVGEKGRDIHDMWTDLADADKLTTYYKCFKDYVAPKSNIIFARY